MAATNAFAIIPIKKGNVDTQTLTTDHNMINPNHYAHQLTSSPVVHGKQVCNTYGRNGKFDLIYRADDSATMGKNMTEAHSCCLALSTAARKGTAADRFRYPIGTSNEHKLIAAFVRALHDKPYNYYLSKLMHLTASHIWFLRCPDGYSECRRAWDTYYHAAQFPFFHKIGLEFVDNDGRVRTGHDRGRSSIPIKAFNSIDHPKLKQNVITALTIAECAWESKVFKDGNNSLDTSPATQRMYDMLNETLYALLVYGLGRLDPDGQNNPLTTYTNYVKKLKPEEPEAEEPNPLLTSDAIALNARATSLGAAIAEVKKCYKIGDGVLNIIKHRCGVEENVSGSVKKWAKEKFDELVTGNRSVWPTGVPLPPLPAVPINFTPPPAKRPRVAASPVPSQGQQQVQLTIPTFGKTHMRHINEKQAALALLMLGQKTKFSENQGEPATKRQRTSSTEFLNNTVPPLPLPLHLLPVRTLLRS